jgi:hypothetical protein
MEKEKARKQKTINIRFMMGTLQKAAVAVVRQAGSSETQTLAVKVSLLVVP